MAETGFMKNLMEDFMHNSKIFRTTIFLFGESTIDEDSTFFEINLLENMVQTGVV